MKSGTSHGVKWFPCPFLLLEQNKVLQLRRRKLSLRQRYRQGGSRSRLEVSTACLGAFVKFAEQAIFVCLPCATNSKDERRRRSLDISGNWDDNCDSYLQRTALMCTAVFLNAPQI